MADMPSKGIDVHTYIAVDGVEVSYEVPKKTITHNDHNLSRDHLEVDKKDIGGFSMTGRFTFTVKHNGQEITNQWCDVNALTGMVILSSQAPPKYLRLDRDFPVDSD